MAIYRCPSLFLKLWWNSHSIKLTIFNGKNPVALSTHPVIQLPSLSGSKHFISAKGNPLPTQQPLLTPPSLQPLATTKLLSVSVGCLFWAFYTNGVISHVICGMCLLYLAWCLRVHPRVAGVDTSWVDGWRNKSWCICAKFFFKWFKNDPLKWGRWHIGPLSLICRMKLSDEVPLGKRDQGKYQGRGNSNPTQMVLREKNAKPYIHTYIYSIPYKNNIRLLDVTGQVLKNIYYTKPPQTSGASHAAQVVSQGSFK